MLFKEEDTSALAGFHAGPLSGSNWNLEMLVFAEGGKPENPEKNPWSKARTNNKFNPHMAPDRNQTRATLVGGKHSHHCANCCSRLVKRMSPDSKVTNKMYKQIE